MLTTFQIKILYAKHKAAHKTWCIAKLKNPKVIKGNAAPPGLAVGVKGCFTFTTFLLEHCVYSLRYSVEVYLVEMLYLCERVFSHIVFVCKSHQHVLRQHLSTVNIIVRAGVRYVWKSCLSFLIHFCVYLLTVCLCFH